MRPLPKTKSVHHHLNVFTGGFTTLKRAIAVTTITLTSTQTASVDNSVIPIGISMYVLIDNWPKSFSALFAAVTIVLVTKHYITTTNRTA